MLKKKIETFCNQLGLDVVGFIPCRRFDELSSFFLMRQEKQWQNEFEEQEIEKRINPNLYLESGKTIISIAFPYYDGKNQTSNGFSIYTKRMDYHRVVMQYLNQILEYIESLGGTGTCLVDSNSLPERYIAYLAGLGFLGRNNMLITKQYGSYVFLGEIITDLEIDCSDLRTFEDISRYEECNQCNHCLTECPTKSIHMGGCNPNICLSYLTQKKELSDQEASMLKGNVFGCDFCQLQCPYNQQAQYSKLSEFATCEYMEQEEIVYAEMTNRYFKDYIKQTSCGWRGKKVIQRNATLALEYRNKNSL